MKPLLSGLWAWLSWDWERIAGVSFAHGAASSWAPRYFSECSDEPWTALWEAALIVGLTVMIVGKELHEKMRQHWPHKHGCYYRPCCWLCRLRMVAAYWRLWWRFERER